MLVLCAHERVCVCVCGCVCVGKRLQGIQWWWWWWCVCVCMCVCVCLCMPQADDALSYITELIPSHHEDMALIEQLDQVLEMARKKARTDLSRNSEASAAIDAGTPMITQTEHPHVHFIGMCACIRILLCDQMCVCLCVCGQVYVHTCVYVCVCVCVSDLQRLPSLSLFSPPLTQSSPQRHSRAGLPGDAHHARTRHGRALCRVCLARQPARRRVLQTCGVTHRA